MGNQTVTEIELENEVQALLSMLLLKEDFVEVFEP